MAAHWVSATASRSGALSIGGRPTTLAALGRGTRAREANIGGCGGARRADFSTRPNTSSLRNARGGGEGPLAMRTRATGGGSDAAAPRSNDLLVVGPGVLGRLVAAQWKEEHGGAARVVGETATTMNHESLKSLGCFDEVRTREDGSDSTFPYVLFAAPPSGSEDFAAEVERAADKWDGTGSLLFTSSAAVYDVEEGECTETSKTKAMGASERTDKILSCENAVLSRGGNVLRLVGLYHSKRGAHMYFLKIQTVPRWGESHINLIHYEDAASLSARIQQCGPETRGKIFLGCDNHPVSFQKMMDATLLSGEYKGQCKFTGEAQEYVGKFANNDDTRRALDWAPVHESFESFMKAGAKDSFLEMVVEG